MPHLESRRKIKVEQLAFDGFGNSFAAVTRVHAPKPAVPSRIFRPSEET